VAAATIDALIVVVERQNWLLQLGRSDRDLSQTLRDGCLGYDYWEWIRQGGTMIESKGSHFEQEVILWGVRWYVAYPMSYRQGSGAKLRFRGKT
jgi:hypothetical protein